MIHVWDAIRRHRVRTIGVLLTVFLAISAVRLIGFTPTSLPATGVDSDTAVVQGPPNLRSDLQVALKDAFPGIVGTRVQTRPLQIQEEADITGDRIPAVLVDLGAGGATTEYLALVMFEHGKPTVPSFKPGNGGVSPLMLVMGGGGAGRYGHNAGLLPSKRAVYQASFSKYGEANDYCRADVYAWNAPAGVFELNEQLSDQMRQDYCEKH